MWLGFKHTLLNLLFPEIVLKENTVIVFIKIV